MSEPLTRVYRKGVLEAEGFPISEVSELLAQRDTVVWVDLCGASRHQIHELTDELGLHELAVEDALSPHQRPKLDHYESHSFLASHAVRVDTDLHELSTTEVDAFFNSRWIITIRKDDQFSMVPVLAHWDRSAELAKQGVSFLLYGLLDTIVDRYFHAVEAFDDYYDDVSEAIFSDRPIDPAHQRDWFQMRRALVQFHRLVVPMREAVSGLMRRENTAVSENMYPYFQDVYDHILRVSESTESLRDLVSTIVETNLSLRDFRQNEVMKMVTSWAAIIAVPTLITGWYGMNVPFPGSGTHTGVAVAGGLVVVLSTGLFALFRKRDWL